MSFLQREKYRLTFRSTGQAVQLFIVEQFGFSHYPDGEILAYLDTLADNGANGFRTFGFFPFGLGREEEPYRRSGSDFDLDRFNDTFYQYLRKWVEHAQQRGIVVLYELFDSVGVKYTQLEKYHPFNRFFKNAGGNHERRLNAFTTLGGQLEQQQKAYIKHTVDILKEYPNVIFGIMNEFKGNPRWHYEMSKYVRALAPEHLISGSDDSSPGLDDPNVDIWAIHTGSYSFTERKSNIRRDLAGFFPKIGNKIPTYSTDGFGSRGIACETPEAMTDLAWDVKRNRLQIFRFLDQKCFISRDDAGREYPGGTWVKNGNVYETAQVKRANTATYKAIAAVFQPTPLPVSAPEPVELPPGFLCTFKAERLPSEHPEAFSERGGKAIKATHTQGYLARTPQLESSQEKALPAKPLDVYFSVFIDNNDFDDALILILDVYDPEKKQVLVNKAVTRKQFSKAGAFNLFKLSFTPSPTSTLKFRAYYFGAAYVVLHKIALVQPDNLSQPLTSDADIPNVHAPTSKDTGGGSDGNSPDPEKPDTGNGGDEPSPPKNPHEGIVGIFRVAKLPSAHPGVFAAHNGKAIKATTQEGFLSFGPYVEGYPNKRLEVYFSLLVDNNTADDRQIFTIDVHDAMRRKILAHKQISRREFPAAKQFTLFKLSFTPSSQSRLEFRIFYRGYSYVAADKIAVVEPEKIQFADASEVPDSIDTSIPVTPVQPPEPDTDNGNAILRVPQFNEAMVDTLRGKVYGGNFRGNTFTPSDRGGILFNGSLDLSRRIKIELEIEGNIANVNKRGEHDGGKVTLFTIKEKNGPYYISLQRMYRDYREGGVFRFILTNNYGSTEGAAYLITAKGLGGLYQTLNWGNEPHTIQILLDRNRCRMKIDDNYESTTSRCSGNIGGKKPCEIMVGNRLLRHSNQHAITRFKRFKIEYV